MTGLLNPKKLATLPASEAPILLVVVDTEEEFDWSKRHAREQTSVTAMDNIHVAQKVFDRFGVSPCYVIDFPVASQRQGFQMLKEFHAEGRCSIGAHLHPWVNPPFEEILTVQNSYPGNLPSCLEMAKLKILKEMISENLGVEAVIYKAGRYGLGENTEGVLEDLGFTVDLSVATGFDYSDDGGPDFFHFPNDPFWFGSKCDLLSIPCTGGLVGMLAESLPELYRKASRGMAQRLRMPGILSRCGIIERIRLSPEGYDLSELIRLSETLLAQGLRVLTMSFHSPSLKPGCTPYVRSSRDQARFVSVISDYLGYFLEDKGGRVMGPAEIRDYHLTGTAGQSTVGRQGAA